MSSRKVKMTLPYGAPMVVMNNPKFNGGTVEPLFIFSLDTFEFKDGNVKWKMSTPGGREVEGNLGEVDLVTLPNNGGTVKVVLSIPVTLHKQNPVLSPEFIIIIPEHLRVHPLSSLKKRYGTKEKDLFR